MINAQWYVGTEPVIVEGELSNYPATTVGEEITFEFYIKDDIDGESSSTGATYGGPAGGTYGGSLGFTYGGGGLEYKTAEERYNRLKEYLRYAGYATTQQTIGSAYFTEPLDFENAEVDTLLVPIYPHDDIKEARGVWGVITGGDDSTEIFGAIARIDISVFVLAEYDEYSTEQEVRDEFEASI